MNINKLNSCKAPTAQQKPITKLTLQSKLTVGVNAERLDYRLASANHSEYHIILTDHLLRIYMYFFKLPN